MVKLKHLLVIVIVAVSGSGFAQEISKNEALEMTKRFETTGLPIKAHVFGTPVLNQVVAPSYVSHVLAFKGIDSNGSEHLIFKRSSDLGKIEDQFYAANDGHRCPPFCPPPPGIGMEKAGRQISESSAQQMISSYQASNDNLVASFDANELRVLLSNDKAVAIYFANAIDINESATLVAVGISATGDLMWDGLVLKASMVKMKYPEMNASKK